MNRTLSEFCQANFSFPHFAQPLLIERQAKRNLAQRFTALRWNLGPENVELAKFRKKGALPVCKLRSDLKEFFTDFDHPLERQRAQQCRTLGRKRSELVVGLLQCLDDTSKEFADPELASEIQKTLELTGLDPACLQLEIIETIVMGDAEKSSHVLSQLKALGVRLSIDDFGTGYSSLSRLRRIPVDTLKIDRAFISHMESDSESREIVRIIIMLAHNLALKVVAEGTETEAQITLLKQLNCEMAQGYLFSRPAPEQRMSELLSAQGFLAASAGR